MSMLKPVILSIGSIGPDISHEPGIGMGFRLQADVLPMWESGLKAGLRTSVVSFLDFLGDEPKSRAALFRNRKS
jgi:hypothetical protein